MLQIRQADECDIRDLVDLDDECFDTYYYEKTKFSKSDFQDYLRWKKSVLLVAVLDSRIIGYVAGTVRTSRAQSTAHLDSIAVSSVTQQKGIGSQLMYFFIQEAKRQFCKMVMLEVATANKEGLRFFSKRGFREIANLPEYYGRGLDGVLMGLSILNNWGSISGSRNPFRSPILSHTIPPTNRRRFLSSQSLWTMRRSMLAKKIFRHYLGRKFIAGERFEPTTFRSSGDDGTCYLKETAQVYKTFRAHTFSETFGVVVISLQNSHGGIEKIGK